MVACGGDDEDAALPFDDRILVSYEVVPSAQLETWDNVDPSAAPYEARATLTREVFMSLWPEMVAAVGLDAAAIETQEVPGGYLLATNPALQSAFARTDTERAAIERFAAAQGYVFRQWDVLITDFGSNGGNTGYAVVAIAELTPARAQAFFVHAAGVDAGLGGGYTAFGDAMLFLNLRDADSDEPYSGLDDAAFVDALDRAAASFAQADAQVVDAGERAVEAWFISNDWAAAGAGEELAAMLDAQAVQALDDVRGRYDDVVAAWVEDQGLMPAEARGQVRPGQAWDVAAGGCVPARGAGSWRAYDRFRCQRAVDTAGPGR